MTALPDSTQLRAQWKNPGDILSLLLLIGGDVVQKATAQLVGVRFRLWKNGPAIGFTPVAFSFGWVAYAFTSLMEIIGGKSLMPEPDWPILVVNCRNGYVRANNSWVLGRLMRDHEARLDAKESRFKPGPPLSSSSQGREISLRVDIFTADIVSGVQRSEIGPTWILGCVVIVAQMALASVPWIKHGEWAIFMVTICGTFFALLTGSLPQWWDEKWSARLLPGTKDQFVALTRGNGHRHVMVIIGKAGTWDLEALASGRTRLHPSTRWVCIALAVGWILLLISVSGLHYHTWYLVGVGGLGMLQNVWAAGTDLKPEELKIPLRPFHLRPTVIGYQRDTIEKAQANVMNASDSEEESENKPFPEIVEESKVMDVMGTLAELEKILPGCGASLLDVFFPGGMQYNDRILSFNWEKKFWKRAFSTMKSRKQEMDSKGTLENTEKNRVADV